MNLLRKAGPAGLEPATSWFVARKNARSRALPALADLCRTGDGCSQGPFFQRLRSVPSCAAPCRSLLRSKGKKRATFPPGEYATTFLRTTAQSTLSVRAKVDELVKRAPHTSEGVLTDLGRPNPCPRFIKNPQPARDLFAVEQIAGGFGDAMHQSHGLLVKLENNYTRSGAGRMPTDVSKIKVECDEHSALEVATLSTRSSSAPASCSSRPTRRRAQPRAEERQWTPGDSRPA